MRIVYPWCVVLLRTIFEDAGQDSPDAVISQPIYPIECTVEKNSYNEADTAKITLNFKEFPFEPRLLRSVGVQVHMGSNDKPGIAPVIDDSTVQFVGFVDVPSIELSETDTTAIFEARDFTALLLDTDIGDEAVDLRKPVHVVIEQLLKEQPSFAEITVELRGIETTPTLAEFKSDWNHKDASDSEEKYWDKIVDLCQQAGLICFIEADKLVITEAQNLTDDSYIELFIYGRNLKNIKISRDLKKKQAPNIEVRSYDDKNKKTIIGKYPTVATSKKVVTKESATSKTEIKRFIIRNINSKEQLDKIAEAIYFSETRSEVKGSIETDETKTIQAGSGKSLMTLRHGDACYIGFDFSDRSRIHMMSKSERSKYLTGIGYPASIASTISAIFDDEKLTGPYYVQKATHRFTNTDGYSLAVDYINFINPDIDLQ